MPSQVNYLLQESHKSCDILVYFHRPHVLSHLKYTELFNLYICKKELPSTLARNQNIYENNIDGYFVITIRGLLKPIYLCRRLREEEVIIRIEMVCLTAGEIWFLRLILLNFMPRSFENARTINGTLYPTFQAAAVAANLVSDITVARECFDQSIGFSTPAALRGLFATLTINGYPTLCIYNDNTYKNLLLQDWLELIDNPLNFEQANNKFLADLQKRLQQEDKNLEMFGFPLPLESDTELERERLKYSVQSQTALYEQLNVQFPNNEDQQRIFDVVMDAVVNASPTKRFFFIDGPGGTGKTTIVQKLIAAIRALGKIVRVCASTTLAATNYNDASSAHSTFKYPVVQEEDKDDEVRTECLLRNTERYILLEQTAIVFWDEFVSNDRELFEAVLRALTGLSIIFVCIGDFRQILPVITNGTSLDTINACISSSPTWQLFTRLRLKINMRLQLNGSTASQTETLLAIGEGRNCEDAIIMSQDTDNHSMQIGLPNIDYFESTNVNPSMEWLYSNQVPYHQTNINSAILTATNESVDQWNAIVQDKNPNDAFELFSHDSFCDVDDPHGYLSQCLSESILNDFNANGVPTHKLKFKVNDICLVTRCMKAVNLATNTRVQIMSISSRILRVRVLDDPHRSQVLIPKIRFKFRLKYGQSYKIMRCQFPLRLAYAFTYNRSQGQTLHKVLLDTRVPPFEHGHLYVAMSRHRNPHNIKIFLNSDQLHVHPYDHNSYMPVIPNVVYPQIIAHCVNT